MALANLLPEYYLNSLGFIDYGVDGSFPWDTDETSSIPDQFKNLTPILAIACEFTHNSSLPEDDDGWKGQQQSGLRSKLKRVSIVNKYGFCVLDAEDANNDDTPKEGNVHAVPIDSVADRVATMVQGRELVGYGHGFQSFLDILGIRDLAKIMDIQGLFVVGHPKDSSPTLVELASKYLDDFEASHQVTSSILDAQIIIKLHQNHSNGELPPPPPLTEERATTIPASLPEEEAKCLDDSPVPQSPIVKTIKSKTLLKLYQKHIHDEELTSPPGPTDLSHREQTGSSCGQFEILRPDYSHLVDDLKCVVPTDPGVCNYLQEDNVSTSTWIHAKDLHLIEVPDATWSLEYYVNSLGFINYGVDGSFPWGSQSTLLIPDELKNLTPILAMACEFTDNLPEECEEYAKGGKPQGEHLRLRQELQRVSIVNKYGFCVYDSFVKSADKGNYEEDNTTDEDSSNEKAKASTVEEVVGQVATLVNGRVLIGHGFQSALDVLGIRDLKQIRDIQGVFRLKYPKGEDCKQTPFDIIGPTLEELAVKFLEGFQASIQTSSSILDAQITLKLYLKYIHGELPPPSTTTSKRTLPNPKERPQTVLPCGHIQEDLRKPVCEVPMNKQCPSCGKVNRVPCHMDPSAFRCLQKVKMANPCGIHSTKVVMTTCSSDNTDIHFCTEMVEITCAAGRHTRRVECHKAENVMACCNLKVWKPLPCGHKVFANCAQKKLPLCSVRSCRLIRPNDVPRAPEPLLVERKEDEIIPTRRLECGHKVVVLKGVKVACNTMIKCVHGTLYPCDMKKRKELERYFSCSHRCGEALECGHECSRTCHAGLTTVAHHGYYKCVELCRRDSLMGTDKRM